LLWQAKRHFEARIDTTHDRVGQVADHAINPIFIHGSEIYTGNHRIMQQSGLLAFGCPLGEQQMGRFSHPAEIRRDLGDNRIVGSPGEQ
jgi:hypothetical protein